MGRRIFNTYGSSHGQVLIFLWATLAKSRARPSIIACDIDDLIFTFFFQQVSTFVRTTPLRYFQLNTHIIHNLLMCYYCTVSSASSAAVFTKHADREWRAAHSSVKVISNSYFRWWELNSRLLLCCTHFLWDFSWLTGCCWYCSSNRATKRA